MNIGKTACIKAKDMGADIALFPEMWSDGYYLPQEEGAVEHLAIEKDSEFIVSFGSLAKELQMAIGITFLEKSEQKPLNSIILFDRKSSHWSWWEIPQIIGLGMTSTSREYAIKGPRLFFGADQPEMVLPAFQNTIPFHPGEFLRHIGSLQIQIIGKLLSVKGNIKFCRRNLSKKHLISCSYDVKAGLKQKSGLQEGKCQQNGRKLRQ